MTRRIGSEGDAILFHTVVQAGSFAGAARRLDMTASGVSRRIKALEERLGTQLIARTTRSLRLTAAGELFSEKCAQVSEDILQAEEMVATAATHPVGTLRVGASAALIEKVLLPLLPSFAEQYPDINIHFIYGGRHLSVTRDRLDVLVTATPVQDAGVVSLKLLDTPWVTCAAESYTRRRGTPAQPENLLGHDCLVPVNLAGEHINRWAYQTKSGPQVIRVQPRIAALSINLLPFALAGTGIARLPYHLARDALAAGMLHPLLTAFPDAESRAVYMVYPRIEFRPLRARALIEHLYGAFLPPDRETADTPRS